MNVWILLTLVISALCAAAGQVFFKIGATGRAAPIEFINFHIVLGLLLYGAGTVLWIGALSQAPLSTAYPFTALTFILVFLFSIVVLHEDVAPRSVIGSGLVVIGLYLVYSGSLK
jgi:undecaprenyl phosphate-alpha-L-ara4N flippase subunit ArnE